MTAASLTGNRQFMWFKPAGRRATQYEAYSVGQQSSPAQWLHVDWPLRFDDGRAPWVAESTALRSAHWGDFRDPTQMWQRPYVAQHNMQEQAIAALVPEALRDSLVDSLVPAWRDRVLGTYYAAWPFVEYGQFLCLCYAVREALSDTLTFSLAFEVSDKLRHSQDIVHFLLTLTEACPGFSDSGARSAWMSDPALVPLREMIRTDSLAERLGRGCGCPQSSARAAGWRAIQDRISVEAGAAEWRRRDADDFSQRAPRLTATHRLHGVPGAARNGRRPAR